MALSRDSYAAVTHGTISETYSCTCSEVGCARQFLSSRSFGAFCSTRCRMRSHRRGKLVGLTANIVVEFAAQLSLQDQIRRVTPLEVDVHEFIAVRAADAMLADEPDPDREIHFLMLPPTY